MTGNFFTIGASLYSMLEVSEAMKIQPEIGFDYITGEIKVHGSIYSGTESGNTAIFTLGLSLILQTSPRNIFVVTPLFGLGDDVTTFGISLGLVRKRTSPFHDQTLRSGSGDVKHHVQTFCAIKHFDYNLVQGSPGHDPVWNASL